MADIAEQKGEQTNGGEQKDVFNATLATNGQITVGKHVRDALDLQPGDIVFCRLIKVISPDGKTKHDITVD